MKTPEEVQAIQTALDSGDTETLWRMMTDKPYVPEAEPVENLETAMCK